MRLNGSPHGGLIVIADRRDYRRLTISTVFRAMPIFVTPAPPHETSAHVAEYRVE